MLFAFLCTRVWYDETMRTSLSYFHFFILMLGLLAASSLPVRPPEVGAGQAPCLFAGSGAPADDSPGRTAQPTAPKQNRLAADLLHAVARVQPLLDRYGYAAVFVAVLVEGFGLVAPGQTILMAASFAAGRGDLNLIYILLLTFVAAVLGNSLGYLIGVKGGRPLLLKLRVREERLQRLEGYFGRYGQGVIVVARFFDGLRQLNGIMAGLLHMPWKTFTICNILGAVLWTGVWGLGAYFLEKEIARVHLPIRLVEPLIAMVILLAVLAFFLYTLWPARETKT
jgi:membrane protein DedA with SNARE-associated domain